MALSPPSAAGSFERFVEPDWDAPLDMDAVLAAVPKAAQISGMFISPLVAAAKSVASGPSGSRERYVAFQFYPLREHIAWLRDAARSYYSDRPPRVALRKLGRGAPAAFLGSTLGKVMLSASSGPEEMLSALAKAYALNLKPGSATVRELSAGRAIIGLEDIHYFVDSHHVGVFEGLLKHAGARARVRVHALSESAADLLVEW